MSRDFAGAGMVDVLLSRFGGKVLLICTVRAKVAYALAVVRAPKSLATPRPEREGCQNPVPSCRGPLVPMHEATESIPSLDLPTRGRRQCQLGRGWYTSAERPVRALAVVVLDEDAQDPVELAQSGDQ